MPPAKPWLRFYGSVPASVDYPEVGLYEAFRRSAERNPDAPAYDFFGKIDFKVLQQEETQKLTRRLQRARPG